MNIEVIPLKHKKVYLMGINHNTEHECVGDAREMLDSNNDMIFLIEASAKLNKRLNYRLKCAAVSLAITHKDRVFAADSRLEMKSYEMTTYLDADFNKKYKKKCERYFNYHRNYFMLAKSAITDCRNTYYFKEIYCRMGNKNKEFIDSLLEKLLYDKDIDFKLWIMIRNYEKIAEILVHIVTYLNDVIVFMLILASTANNIGVFYGKQHVRNIESFIRVWPV